jgi:hypothetical protein
VKQVKDDRSANAPHNLIVPALFHCPTTLFSTTSPRPSTDSHNASTQSSNRRADPPIVSKKVLLPRQNWPGFNDRYRAIAKLGYGAYSTVWLAWDERSYPTRIVLITAPIADLKYRANEYASLKVSVRIDNHNAELSPVLNEINMLQRMKQFADKDHPGLDFTRLARDIFETESLAGRHHCIAYKPQGNSVRTLQEAIPNAMIPKTLVKSLIHRLFISVNWLHATCGVAHTGKSTYIYILSTYLRRNRYFTPECLNGN